MDTKAMITYLSAPSNGFINDTTLSYTILWFLFFYYFAVLFCELFLLTFLHRILPSRHWSLTEGKCIVFISNKDNKRSGSVVTYKRKCGLVLSPLENYRKKRKFWMKLLDILIMKISFIDRLRVRGVKLRERSNSKSESVKLKKILLNKRTVDWRTSCDYAFSELPFPRRNRKKLVLWTETGGTGLLCWLAIPLLGLFPLLGLTPSEFFMGFS